MRITVIFFITFFLINFSCNSIQKNEIVEIHFDNLRFTLPNKVSKLKEIGDLKYQVFRGFRGKSKNYNIFIQFENYPIWNGSENVDEDFYLSKKVVGMTFIKPDCTSTKKIISFLSKQYAVTFVNENNEYQIAKLNNYSIVVYIKKNLCYISFYSGINKNRIQEFIRGAW